MGWTTRVSTSNLTVLGDDEGQVTKVAGLLADVTQDSVYPSRSNYELVQKDGTSLHLAGSASLGRQLFPKDIGKFVKATFTGWGASPNGKFKVIEVQVFDGELTPAMKTWPRWAELQPTAAPKPVRKAAPSTPDVQNATAIAEDFPPIPDAEDDDLPF